MSVSVRYQSCSPHRSLNILMTVNDPSVPNQLLVEFLTKGWERSEMEIHEPDGSSVICLSKEGSGIFGEWNQSERKAFEQEADAILSSYGIEKIPRLAPFF